MMHISLKQLRMVTHSLMDSMDFGTEEYQQYLSTLADSISLRLREEKADDLEARIQNAVNWIRQGVMRMIEDGIVRSREEILDAVSDSGEAWGRVSRELEVDLGELCAHQYMNDFQIALERRESREIDPPDYANFDNEEVPF